MTPPTLKAKEFEEAIMKAALRLEGADMGRYGVQSFTVGKPGATETRPVQSLPDFEGVFDGGRQFIIEAKVCSGASFELRKVTIKPRQVSHMLKRSRCGVPCFVLIHFNERKLKNKHEPGETRAFEVSDRDPRWQAFVDAYAEAKKTGKPVVPQGSISRDLAVRISRRVVWTCPKGCKTYLPDLGELLGVLPSQPTLL